MLESTVHYIADLGKQSRRTVNRFAKLIRKVPLRAFQSTASVDRI